MAQLSNMVVGRFTDCGNVRFEGQVFIEDDTKVTCGIGRDKIGTMEGNRSRCNLGTLLWVPMIRYSVFDGLTESVFAVSQSWTESRVEDSRVSEYLSQNC